MQGRIPPNSRDAEEAVLGAIMLERNKLDDVLEILTDSEMFYYPEHQLVFSAITNLHESGSAVDMISVTEWMNRKGKIDEIGGPYTLAKLTNSVVSSANILTHAVIIKEKWIRRKQIEISGELLRGAYDEDKSVFETSDEIGQKIDDLAMQGVTSDLVPINTQLVSTLKELEEQRNRSEEMTGISSGFQKLDALTNGWQKSDLIILAARPSVGKCLGKGTKVIMFDGTIRNVEDVMVGDQLMGDDSTPRTVLSLARGREMMYTVKQVRGITYRVNKSHILSLMASRNQGLSKHGDKRDIPLNEYLSQTKKFQNNWKGYKSSIEFDTKPLEIPPYLLGIWLGDGTSTKPEITKPDEEIMNYLSGYADGAGLRLTVRSPKNKCRSYSLVSRTYRDNNFVSKLKNLDLLNNKHIPHTYIANSSKNRYELLAGIIDTDGYLSPTGCYEITQKSERLIKDIKYLCDTLGFRTTLSKRQKKIKSIGFIGTYYTLIISGNIWDIPVKISRKRWGKSSMYRDHLISGITVTEDCIDDYYGFVIDGNHRFLLEDCTVTHNTAFALNLAINASSKVNVIVFSLEMSNNQLAKRLISISEKISMSELNRPKEMGSIVWDKVARAVNLSSKKIYLNDITDISPLQIKAKTKSLMKKVRRLNGSDEEFMVIVDYLQLAESGKKDKKGNREQFISEISRGLKKTAKELEVPVIALSQLSRAVSDDEKPSLSALRESGAIEQDADVVMFLYRPTQAEKNEIPDLEYANYLDIAKNRNGAIESKIVFFNDLSIQTFSDSKIFNDTCSSIPEKITIRPNYNIDDDSLRLDTPF